MNARVLGSIVIITSLFILSAKLTASQVKQGENAWPQELPGIDGVTVIKTGIIFTFTFYQPGEYVLDFHGLTASDRQTCEYRVTVKVPENNQAPTYTNEVWSKDWGIVIPKPLTQTYATTVVTTIAVRGFHHGEYQFLNPLSDKKSEPHIKSPDEKSRRLFFIFSFTRNNK